MHCNLCRQICHGKVSVRLVSPGSERRKSWDKEMESREWHHVHGELANVSVQLTGEPQAGSHSRHGVLKKENGALFCVSICCT
jgi:hypothetical protein